MAEERKQAESGKNYERNKGLFLQMVPNSTLFKMDEQETEYSL